MLINRCLPVVFALSFSVASHAQQVWIEQDATSAKLYFGEYTAASYATTTTFLLREGLTPPSPPPPAAPNR